MTDLQKQLKQLAKKNKFSKIVSVIEKISEVERDWETAGYYIRALNNTAQYDRAIDVSMQYKEQCANDAYWYYLLGYAYYGLDQHEEAKKLLLRGKDFAESGTAVLSNIDRVLTELHEISMEASVKQIIEKFKEETAIPSVVLTATWSSDIKITASKFGGIPYLPKDYIYPATAKGEPLKLLAQLNFAELPKLENFPASGILQFYVLPDDAVGLKEWPNLINGGTYRVIYHKEILPDDMQMKDFPEIKFINGEGEYSEGWFPFEGEYLVKGNISNCPMTYSTHEFNEAFALFCKKNNIESYFEPYYADYLKMQKSMKKDEFNDWERKQRKVQGLVWSAFGDNINHRISGYPIFTQYDPRVHGNQKKYDTLLFQMVSEWDNDNPSHEIMWGDSGVANFFINLEDLKKLNFQNVIYTWDCG